MTTVSAPSNEQLQQENARLLALIEQREQTIQTLQHQLHLFRSARFGRKSEKGVVPEQMALQFDEALPVAATTEPTTQNTDAQTETITYTRAKKNTGRKRLIKWDSLLNQRQKNCVGRLSYFCLVCVVPSMHVQAPDSVVSSIMHDFIPWCVVQNPVHLVCCSSLHILVTSAKTESELRTSPALSI